MRQELLSQKLNSIELHKYNYVRQLENTYKLLRLSQAPIGRNEIIKLLFTMSYLPFCENDQIEQNCHFNIGNALLKNFFMDKLQDL